MTEKTIETLSEKLDLLIEAVGRLAPKPPRQADLGAADCFVWAAERGELEPVIHVNRVDLGLIRGVDRVRDILLDNTRRFAAGLPANNVLLWGARGMGKSSLVKAVHATVDAGQAGALKLIEIHREDIDTLPRVLALLKAAPYRFILFCDDLSFDHDDTSYKSLKAALEGGVEGRPGERDLLCHVEPPAPPAPRDDRQRTLDRHQSVGLGRGEGVAVGPLRPVARLPQMLAGRLSRHDRGLCRATTDSQIDPAELRAEALEWATTRGSRSGRVAWQFTQDLAGRLGRPLRD